MPSSKTLADCLSRTSFAAVDVSPSLSGRPAVPLLEGAPWPAAGLDSQGRLQHCNNSFNQWLADEPSLGLTPQPFSGMAGVASFCQALRALQSSGTPQTGTLTHRGLRWQFLLGPLKGQAELLSFYVTAADFDTRDGIVLRIPGRLQLIEASPAALNLWRCARASDLAQAPLPALLTPVKGFEIDSLAELRRQTLLQKELSGFLNVLGRHYGWVSRAANDDLVEVHFQPVAGAEIIWSAATRGHYDELTRFFVRKALHSQLAAAAARARNGFAQSIVCLDIDDFKSFNDLGGQALGDSVLVKVSDLIREFTREVDPVIRQGADEFCIILDGVSAGDAQEWASMLTLSLTGIPVQNGTVAMTVSVTCGVAAIGTDDPDGSRAWASADAACSRGKRSSRGRVQVAHLQEDERAARIDIARISHRLRSALDSGQLRHVFEWLTPLGPGRAPRIELLSRMVENGRVISPGVFITAAEHTGLIRRVDECVFDYALALLPSLDPSVVERIHVNISPVSINAPEFVASILSSLHVHSELASRLCFEITETTAFQNIDNMRIFVDAVRRLGVEVYLDDFGVGANSLSQVRLIPLDGLKIDGCFVRQLRRSDLDQTIVRAMHTIATTMQLPTVAEFVLDEETADLLQGMGVTFAQGDWAGRELDPALIGRPVVHGADPLPLRVKGVAASPVRLSSR